ncbi:hypothetical protein [Flavobacterium sp. GCM10027622]|uniref:hypothetical protein n=1 Tax=unclassified Flavobacterium TaxID=196869 RepID=UPI003610A956
MKLIYIVNCLFGLILMTSCNKKDEGNMNYFDFDELEYYHKNITQNAILAEYEKSKSANYNENYLKIVENEYPSNLNDKEFITDIIKFGYQKKLLEKSKYNQIDQVFSKNDCIELTTSGCIPIYRDIFIFKQKGKIIGVAKVCFECRMAHIVGSKQNWDYFGECGDYEKLKDLIK